LAELERHLARLPYRGRRQLLALCQELGGWSQRQQRLVQAAQEIIDQQRLDIKYLVFDLEATRRERDAEHR
jgi:hypothetical protein